MTARDNPPDWTKDSILNLRIGGSWKPEWAGIKGLDALASGIDAARRETRRVAMAREKVDELPDTQRPLRLDSLAKAGKSALGSLARSRTGASNALEALRADLDNRSREALGTPRADVHNALAAQQIRERIARAKSPSAEARKYVDDAQVMAGILAVPPAASGLTPKQVAELRAHAEQVHVPEVAATRRTVEKAEEEFFRGLGAAEEAVAERTGLVQGADGSWRAPWEVEDED